MILVGTHRHNITNCHVLPPRRTLLTPHQCSRVTWDSCQPSTLACIILDVLLLLPCVASLDSSFSRPPSSSSSLSSLSSLSSSSSWPLSSLSLDPSHCCPQVGSRRGGHSPPFCWGKRERLYYSCVEFNYWKVTFEAEININMCTPWDTSIPDDFF